MYTIDNKFEAGKAYWTIYRKPHKIPCPICNANGSFTYKGYDVWCKNCVGTGFVETNQTIFDFCRVKVKSINVKINNDSEMFIKYKVNPIDNISQNIRNRSEHSLFKTKEEAEEYCKKLNTGEVVLYSL